MIAKRIQLNLRYLTYTQKFGWNRQSHELTKLYLCTKCTVHTPSDYYNSFRSLDTAAVKMKYLLYYRRLQMYNVCIYEEYFNNTYVLVSVYTKTLSWTLSKECALPVKNNCEHFHFQFIVIQEIKIKFYSCRKVLVYTHEIKIPSLQN